MPTEQVKLLKNSSARDLKDISFSGGSLFNTHGRPTTSQYLGDAMVFPSQDENQEEKFAQVQPNLDKMGNGLAKLALGTIAVTGQGIGSLYGIGSALYHNDISKMSENAVSDPWNRLKDYVDEEYVQYATTEEKNSLTRFIPFFKGSSSVYFGSLADGAAFILGSYIPGIGAGKLVGAFTNATSKGLMASAKAAGYIDEVGRATAGAEALAYKTLTNSEIPAIALNSKNFASKMAKASGVLSKSEAGIVDIATDILAAHNEATIEANEGRKKFVNDRIDEIINKTGVVPTDAELDRIEEDSKDLYTKRYGLNLAIVSASNISQFGNAFKTRTQNTIERFNKIKDTLKKGADDVYSYEAPKISKYIAWLKNPLTEKFEEGAQFTVEKALDKYYTDRYYNPNKADLGAAILYGIGETFGTTEGWDNMMTGFILGFVGGGGIRSATKEERGDSKSLLSRIKFDLGETGFGKPYAEAKEQAKDAAKLVDFLNKRNEHLSILFNGIASNKASEEKIVKLLKESNPLELQKKLKDEEYGQLMTTILTAYETGQSQWLLDSIKEQAAKYTKDEAGIDEYKQRYGVPGQNLDPNKSDQIVIGERASKISTIIKKVEGHYKDIDVLFPNISDNQKRDYIFTLMTSEDSKRRLLSVYDDIKTLTGGLIDPMAIRMVNNPGEYHSALKKAYKDNEDALMKGLSNLDIKKLTIQLNDAFHLEQQYEVYKNASDAIVNIGKDYEEQIHKKYGETYLKNYERIHEVSRIREIGDREVTRDGEKTSMMNIYLNHAGSTMTGDDGVKYKFKKDDKGVYDPHIIVNENGEEQDAANFFDEDYVPEVEPVFTEEEGQEKTPEQKQIEDLEKTKKTKKVKIVNVTTEELLKWTNETVPKIVKEANDAIKELNTLFDNIHAGGVRKESISSALGNITVDQNGKILNYEEVIEALGSAEENFQAIKENIIRTFNITDELRKSLYKDLLEATVKNPLYYAFLDVTYKETLNDLEDLKQGTDFVQSIIDSIEAIKKSLADMEPEVELKRKVKAYKDLIKDNRQFRFQKTSVQKYINYNNIALADIKFTSEVMTDNIDRIVAYNNNIGILSKKNGYYVISILDSDDIIEITEDTYEGNISDLGITPVIVNEVTIANAKDIIPVVERIEKGEVVIKDSFANFLNVKLSKDKKYVYVSGHQFLFESNLFYNEQGSLINNKFQPAAPELIDVDGNRVQVAQPIIDILKMQYLVESIFNNVEVKVSLKIGDKNFTVIYNDKKHITTYKGKLYELRVKPIYNKDGFAGLSEISLLDNKTQDIIFLDENKDSEYIEMLNNAYIEYDRQQEELLELFEKHLNLNDEVTSPTTTLQSIESFKASGSFRSFDKSQTRNPEEIERELLPTFRYTDKERGLLETAIRSNIFYLDKFVKKINNLTEGAEKAKLTYADPTVIDNKFKFYTVNPKHDILDIPYILSGNDDGATLESKAYFFFTNLYNVKKETIIINNEEIEVEAIAVTEKTIPDSLKGKLTFINGKRGVDDIDIKAVIIKKRATPDSPIEPIIIEETLIFTSLPFYSLEKDKDGNYATVNFKNKEKHGERFHMNMWEYEKEFQDLSSIPSLIEEEQSRLTLLTNQRNDIIKANIEKIIAIREEVLSNDKPTKLFLPGKTSGSVRDSEGSSPTLNTIANSFFSEKEKEDLSSLTEEYDPKNAKQKELLDRFKFYVGNESQTTSVNGSLLTLFNGNIIVGDKERQNVLNVANRKLHLNEAEDLYNIIDRLSKANLSGVKIDNKLGIVYIDKTKVDLNYAGGFYVWNFGHNSESFEKFQFGIFVEDDGTVNIKTDGVTHSYSSSDVEKKSAEILKLLLTFRRAYDKDGLTGEITRRKKGNFYAATIMNGKVRKFLSADEYKYHIMFETVKKYPLMSVFAKPFVSHLSSFHNEKQFYNKNLFFSIKSKEEVKDIHKKRLADAKEKVESNTTTEGTSTIASNPPISKDTNKTVKFIHDKLDPIMKDFFDGKHTPESLKEAFKDITPLMTVDMMDNHVFPSKSKYRFFMRTLLALAQVPEKHMASQAMKGYDFKYGHNFEDFYHDDYYDLFLEELIGRSGKTAEELRKKRDRRNQAEQIAGRLVTDPKEIEQIIEKYEAEQEEKEGAIGESVDENEVETTVTTDTKEDTEESPFKENETEIENPGSEEEGSGGVGGDVDVTIDSNGKYNPNSILSYFGNIFYTKRNGFQEFTDTEYENLSDKTKQYLIRIYDKLKIGNDNYERKVVPKYPDGVDSFYNKPIDTDRKKIEAARVLLSFDPRRESSDNKIKSIEYPSQEVLKNLDEVFNGESEKYKSEQSIKETTKAEAKVVKETKKDFTEEGFGKKNVPFDDSGESDDINYDNIKMADNAYHFAKFPQITDINTELDNIQTMLGLSDDEKSRLAAIVYNNSEGLFMSNGDILLKQTGVIGRGYHEAFHKVFRMYMTDAESNYLINLVRKKYPNYTYIQAEERLAEEFRYYMLTGKVNPELTETKGFLEAILAFLEKLFGFGLENRFNKIKKGGFSTLIPVTNRFTNIHYAVKMEGDRFITRLSNEQQIDEMSDLALSKIENYLTTDIISFSKDIDKEFIKTLIKDAFNDEEFKKTRYGIESGRGLRANGIFVSALYNEIVRKLQNVSSLDLEKEEEEEGTVTKEKSTGAYQDAHERDFKSSVPKPVKLLLLSIKDQKRTNLIGLPKPISVPQMIRDLVNGFANMSGEADITAYLREKAKKDFRYAALLERLSLDKPNLDPKGALNRNNLKQKFFSFLTKTKHDMIGYRYDENGNLKQIRLQDEQIVKDAKSRWLLNLRRLNRDEGGFLDVTKIPDKGDRSTYDMSPKRAREFADYLGITLHEEMWKSKKTLTDLYTVHSSLTASLKSSVKMRSLDSIYNTVYGDEGTSHLHMALKALALANAKFETDVVSNSLTSATGSIIYNVTPQSSLTHAVAETVAKKPSNVYAASAQFTPVKETPSTPNMGMLRPLDGGTGEEIKELSPVDYIKIYFEDALNNVFHFFTAGGSNFENAIRYNTNNENGSTGFNKIPESTEELALYISRKFIPAELAYLYDLSTKSVNGYIDNTKKVKLSDKYQSIPDVETFTEKSIFYKYIAHLANERVNKGDTGAYANEKTIQKDLDAFIKTSIEIIRKQGLSEKEMSDGELIMAFSKQMAINLDISKSVFGSLSVYGEDPYKFFKRVSMANGPKEYFTPDVEFLTRFLPRNDNKRNEDRANLAFLVISEAQKQSLPDNIIEHLKESMGEKSANKYKTTEYADGTVIVKLDGYRDLMATWGEWGDRDEANYYRELDEEDVNETSSNFAYVNSQKGQFFANNFDGVPYSNKSAVMPTVPSQFEKGDIGFHILELLDKYNLDGIMLPSTVKNNALRKEAHHDLFIETTNPDTGQIDITVNTDVKEVSIVQLPLKDFGRQVVTDVKDATKTTYSVQMNKNLISGLYEEGQIAVKSWHSFNILEDSAVAISSEEEAKAYVSNLINNLNESTEKQLEIRYFALLKKLGLKDVNGVISANEEDFKNLKKTLLEAATNNGVSANIINNINNTFSDESLAKYEFVMAREVIEHLLNSTVRRNLIERKINGKQAILGTSLMYKNLRKFTQEDLDNELEALSPYRPNEEGKYTEPLEVYLPHHFREKFGIGTEVDLDNVDPRLLRILATRIPNQAQSSIESIKIKGFLPQTMGDIIITPAVMVTKSGHDFDVDKLNLYFFNSYVNDGMHVPFVRTQDPVLIVKQLLASKTTKDAFRARDLENSEKLETYLTQIKEAKSRLWTYGNKLFETKKKLYELSEETKAIIAANPSANIDSKYAIKNELDSEIERLTPITENLQQLVAEGNEFIINFINQLPENLRTPLEVYENEMLNIQHEIFLNETNFDEMLIPNSQDSINDAAKKHGKMHENNITESKWGYLRHIGPLNHILYALTNREAADLIAIAAKATVSHSQSQLIGIKLKRPLNILSKYTNGTSFSSRYVKTSTGEKSKLTISDFIQQVLSGVVDAEKGDAIIRVNLNKITINTYLLLLQNGVHPENIFDLINNKHYLDSIALWKSENTGKSYSAYLKSSITEIKNQEPLNFARIDRYTDKEILNYIVGFNEYQSEQISLNKFLSPDTVNFNNQNDVYYFIEDFDEFVETSKMFDTEALSKIETDITVSSFYKYIREWNKINDKFSLFSEEDYGSVTVRKLKDYIKDKLKYKNAKARTLAYKKVDTSLITAILQNFGRAPINRIEELFKGNNSLPMRFYEEIKSNEKLVAYFGVLSSDMKDNLALLTVRPSIEEVNEIANLLHNIFFNGVKGAKLFYDTLDFLIVQGGIQRSPINFIDYLPSTYTLDNTIKSIEDYSNDPDGLLATFIPNFFLNNANDNYLVPILNGDRGVPQGTWAYKTEKDAEAIYVSINQDNQFIKLPVRNDRIYSREYWMDIYQRPVLRNTDNIKEDIVKPTTKSTPTQKVIEQPIQNKEGIEIVNRYSDSEVKANPDKIYVFGDNTDRRGTGGQASIRNNLNAFGIATKVHPTNNADAFMSDKDLENNKKVIDSDIQKILDQNKPLVFPKDGFGTGLAKLKEKAPQTYQHLKEQLLVKFGFDNDTGKFVEQPINKEIKLNEVKGIEINSYQTGLGNSLTNVHYAKNGKSNFDIVPTDKSLKLTKEAKNKWGESVEAWYKSNNAQSKGIPEGVEGDKFDMDLMVGLITDKLTQYPNLVEQINQNGGLAFLQKSTHNMGSGRWSSKNSKNMFINSLIQAYKNVNQPTEIKPKIDSSKKIENLKRGDIINFQQQEFLVERVKNEGIDVRDVNTGDVDFISTEDYINETQEQPIQNKEGVDFVFEQTPELSEIGTQQQYSEYLDSKEYKQIYYHYTISDNKFDKFDFHRIGTNNLRNTSGVDTVSLVDNIKLAKAFGEFGLDVYSMSKQDVEDFNDEYANKYSKNIVFVGINNKEVNKKQIFKTKLGNGFEINVENLESLDILGSKQDIKDFEKFVKQPINKEGIDFLFEQSPELASIGTQEQYSQYLNQIFPNSLVKDIVYHKTVAENFEVFDKEKVVTGGFYFTRTRDRYDHVADRTTKKVRTISAILNLLNPDIEDTDFASEGINEWQHIENYKKRTGKDSIIDDTGHEEIIVFEPEQIHILGSKQDIEGFKNWVNGRNNFGKDLAKKIQDKLEKLYPEIKLNITNNPVWEQGDNIFNQKEYNNQVNYRLKATEKVLDNISKIKQWESNKSIDQNTLWKKISELGIPKEQIELLKNSDGNTIEEKLTSFLANYSYAVEINTSKEIQDIPDYNSETGEQTFTLKGDNYYQYLDDTGNMQYEKNKKNITVKEYQIAYRLYKETEFQPTSKPTDYYSNLTVPGGTNYTENEIATPAITPSIKGHAQFSTDKGIGWFRSDDKENKIVGWKEEDDFLNSETAQYNPITKDDKVIFGHPTIGKSYLKKQGNNDFITLDDDYADEVNAFIDANRGKETRQEYKGRKPKEYNQFMLNLFDRLKLQAKKEGKRLFVSNTNILKERMSDFDKVITIPKDEFKKRFDARGATYGFEDWKSDIDATVAKVDKSKVISTRGYLSDLLEGNPKTRRILEVQSDLFQKGRDNKNLLQLRNEKDSRVSVGKVTDDNIIKALDKQSLGLATNGTIVGYETKTYKRINNEWHEAEPLENYNKPENQFLQLLNKDNNWVTFFVKSIIQDSAKKGYEKVLFPTGNTASKVEGHTTLEEFKKQKEDRIKQLEIEKNKYESSNYIVHRYNEFDSSDKTFEFKSIDEANSFLSDKSLSRKESPKQYYSLPKDNRDVIEATTANITKEINQLKQELERVEIEGFGALKPIYNFYENTVTNILNKTYSKDNVKVITDEYGNTWNEVSINQAGDLSSVMLQRNEANQIIGQANIKAATVLIDAINQKQDTLPHEYAHHYIAWFRDTPIVQEAIKKWGSEEALVQSIGEQAVKQNGEAYNWWNNFVKWIMNQFNSLSKLQKEELTQILTDAFLTRQDLGNKQDIEGFKEFISGKSITEPTVNKEVNDIDNYKGTGISKEEWNTLSTKEKEVLLWQKKNCK